MARDSSIPAIAGRKRYGFMPFSKILVQSECKPYQFECGDHSTPNPSPGNIYTSDVRSVNRQNEDNRNLRKEDQFNNY